VFSALLGQKLNELVRRSQPCVLPREKCPKENEKAKPARKADGQKHTNSDTHPHDPPRLWERVPRKNQLHSYPVEHPYDARFLVWHRAGGCLAVVDAADIEDEGEAKAEDVRELVPRALCDVEKWVFAFSVPVIGNWREWKRVSGREKAAEKAIRAKWREESEESEESEWKREGREESDESERRE
jgi:hypothetical protein